MVKNRFQLLIRSDQIPIDISANINTNIVCKYFYLHTDIADIVSLLKYYCNIGTLSFYLSLQVHDLIMLSTGEKRSLAWVFVNTSTFLL